MNSCVSSILKIPFGIILGKSMATLPFAVLFSTPLAFPGPNLQLLHNPFQEITRSKEPASPQCANQRLRLPLSSQVLHSFGEFTPGAGRVALEPIFTHYPIHANPGKPFPP